MVKLCVKTISLCTKSCACVFHVEKAAGNMKVKRRVRDVLFSSLCSRHRIYAPALFPRLGFKAEKGDTDSQTHGPNMYTDSNASHSRSLLCFAMEINAWSNQRMAFSLRSVYFLLSLLRIVFIRNVRGSVTASVSGSDDCQTERVTDRHT